MSKICAIIGAGEGLGAALAAKFASKGFDIALVSRSEAGSAAATNAAKSARADVNNQFRSADATDPESVDSAVTSLMREMGIIDVLIYNVRGEFTRCEPLDMSYDELEKVYRQEVVGAFAAVKAVLPAMRERKQGTIFFPSATAAFRGSSTHPLYSIGKFGLRALSQSLSKAYAKDGVHFVHVRLDCDLDTPIMQDLYGANFDREKLANTADVAESYWHAYLQPRSAWSNEIELRPYTEKWTY